MSKMTLLLRSIVHFLALNMSNTKKSISVLDADCAYVHKRTQIDEYNARKDIVGVHYGAVLERALYISQLGTLDH